MPTHLANRSELERAWSTEMTAARDAGRDHELSSQWDHLERAHILSQPLSQLHVRTHAAMLATAVRRREWPETLGQLFRLVVAAPGSLTGRYPVGNTGGANVNAFAPMPIPDDLKHVLDDALGAAETEPSDFFSTGTEGLAGAVPVATLELHDGDEIELRIASVVKQIGNDRLRMLGYNGSIPGPALRVKQGSTVVVDVENQGDIEATVHWHGLRVENRYDGVPFETQAPIDVGGHYTQLLQFPDAGMYWYHPHIREDYGLELGLYGTVIVEPSDPSYWPPADRHLTVTVDDLLVEDGKVAPFSRSGPTYTAMGRFGNVMLTNGETAWSEAAAVGEIVRFYVVNCANTRIFNFAINGARMKLIGGDSGRYEKETFVESVLLSPSERAVLDVLFEKPGDVRLEHRTPEHVYDLGIVSVSGAAEGRSAASFETLRTDPELTAARQEMERHLERPPDKVLAFWSEMPLLYGDDGEKTTSETAYHECP